MNVTVEQSIGGEHVAEFLRVYHDAFEPLEELSPLRQSMTDEEFETEMTTGLVMKFVLWDDDGYPAAIACMTTDIACAPWLSPRFYQKRFPDQWERQAIYYVGTILVHPDRRGHAFLGELLEKMVIEVASHNGIAAFDCCGYNADEVGLPDIISAVGEKLCNFERQELDCQHFYAYVSSGLK